MLDSSESEEDLGDDCLDWNHLDDNEALDGQSLLEKKVKTSLVDWVVECNIPRSHVNNLLKRLNNDAGLTYLPLDWRTLMSSKRGKVKVIDMPPGQYHHLEVEPSLHAILVSMEARGMPIPDEMYILFNIDGLPLSNSSSSDFWPILCKVRGN